LSAAYHAEAREPALDSSRLVCGQTGAQVSCGADLASASLARAASARRRGPQLVDRHLIGVRFRPRRARSAAASTRMPRRRAARIGRQFHFIFVVVVVVVADSSFNCARSSAAIYGCDGAARQVSRPVRRGGRSPGPGRRTLPGAELGVSVLIGRPRHPTRVAAAASAGQRGRRATRNQHKKQTNKQKQDRLAALQEGRPESCSGAVPPSASQSVGLNQLAGRGQRRAVVSCSGRPKRSSAKRARSSQSR
jgi:hypothetical protein